MNTLGRAQKFSDLLDDILSKQGRMGIPAGGGEGGNGGLGVKVARLEEDVRRLRGDFEGPDPLITQDLLI